MKLKRLEIIGFKSFANKTVFDIPLGIVGIVGPNGSGKSNTTDAIRWVLGERETKNLRGSKMEDLIFAGTDKKARVSMASVSLIFDNGAGDIPIDFKEVVITRKISRDGNSEYLINDSRVRLKDIVDIFSKMGIGSKGLTIIGQGSGDMFVSSSPQRRMMMVREILGLREYEIKKHESELKLKNTKIHMDKLSAMIQEVLPRLRMLKRQTSKWERRIEIENIASGLEKRYFLLKLYSIDKKLKKIRGPIFEIQKNIDELKIKLDKENKELKEIKSSANTSEKLSDLINKKSKLFSERSNLERILYDINNTNSIRKNSGEYFNGNIDSLNGILKKIMEQLKKTLSKDSLKIIQIDIQKIILGIEKLFKNTDVEYSGGKDIKDEKNIAKNRKVKEEIEIINEKIKGMDVEEKKLSELMRDFQSLFTGIFEKVQKTKDKIFLLEEDKRKIEFKEGELRYQINNLRSGAETSNINWDDLLLEIKNKDVVNNISDEELSGMEQKIERFRVELASIGEIDESLVSEAKDVETHYNLIKKEYEDLLFASDDLKKIIKDVSRILSHKFDDEFAKVNEAFNSYFKVMFGGGRAKMSVLKNEADENSNEDDLVDKSAVDINDEKIIDNSIGIDIDVNVPQKKTSGLDSLSGGERSLVSLAVLFALISVNPPPFIVLDEADAALDEKNSARFASLIKTFSNNTQFIVVTHNRVMMKSTGALYGITMDDAGVSKVLSLKLE